VQGLTLLEYLLRHGGDACVARARAEAPHTLESLAAGFRCVGADGRDTGVNVRHRCQLLLLGVAACAPCATGGEAGCSTHAWPQPG
jgi:hypothetical protein